MASRSPKLRSPMRNDDNIKPIVSKNLASTNGNGTAANENSSYLDSFNVTEGSNDVVLMLFPMPSPGNEPQFIVNLNSNSEASADNEEPLPYSCPSPVTQLSMLNQDGPVPSSTINLDVKVRSYVGSDNYSIVSSLCREFPLLPRNRIDRVFTINMFDYDKTYNDLKKEHSELRQKTTVKVVKADEMKVKDPRYDIATPKSNNSYYPELMKTVSANGRGVTGALGMFYRRVEVDSNGVVLSSPANTNEILKRMVVGTAPRNRGPRKRAVPMITPDASESCLKEIVPDVYNPGLASPLTHPVLATPSSSTKADPDIEENGGGKFFRSKRVANVEFKKRDYVSKELNNSWTGDSTQNAASFMAGLGVVSTGRYKNKNRSRDLDVSVQDYLDSEKLEEMGVVMNPDERKELLDFFNSAEEPEFYQIPGCAYRNAAVIIRLRPFKTMVNLIHRLSTTRNLTTDFISSYRDIIVMRKEVNALLDQCKDISERISRHMNLFFKSCMVDMPSEKEIDNALKEISQSNDDLASHSSYLLISKQPPLLNPQCQLKPYQILGLNWLNMLHHEGVNGILADEMGLGKTVQAIAFLAHLYEIGLTGPHIIMCPSSLLDNWAREIEKWAPKIKVLVYSGLAEARKAIRVKIYENMNTNVEDFNILLTTYSASTSSVEDRALLKRLSFSYGIFDEAHLLKNMMSLRYRNLMGIQVKRRILLTGTPMQNNLVELMSLLSFVMPQIFYENTDILKKMFRIHTNPQRPSKDSRMVEIETERVNTATELLKPFCLRRLKTDVMSQMPPKCEETQLVPMTKAQAAGHANLIEKFREMRNQSKLEIAAANKKRKTNTEDADQPISMEKVMNQLMDLRKISNHVALGSRVHYKADILGIIAQTLHKDKSHARANVELILEDLKLLSDAEVHRVCMYYDCLNQFVLSDDLISNGSGKIFWLDNNIPKMLKEGHRILIFSQFVIMLNLLEDWAKARKHRYLRMDGNTPVVDRQSLIDQFNTDDSIGIFFLSTRVGGLGINLTSADTVILHDLSFNPYQEKQAEDRCHRMGQTKPVKVIKLVSEGTVEENILRIARDKLALEQSLGMPGLTAENGIKRKKSAPVTDDAEVVQENDPEADNAFAADVEMDPVSTEITEDETNAPSLRCIAPHRPTAGSKRGKQACTGGDTDGLDKGTMQKLLTQILEN